MKPRKQRPGQRGNAMVEGALIFGAFMMMLIGVADFAQFLFVHNGITDRVRTAARYGAANTPVDTAAVKNVVLYGRPALGSGVTMNASFNLTPEMVDVQVLGAGTDDNRVQVKVTNYRYFMLSPLVFGTYTGPAITATIPLGVNN